MMEIRSKARRLKMREPNLGLIVVDYLQLMTSAASRREPRAGGVADLALAQGARARPRRADPRALAALPRGRAAPRQAADPLRPARVGLARAGRRPRHASSTATSTTTPRRPTSRASPRCTWPSTETARPDTVKLSFLKRFAKFADLAACRGRRKEGRRRHGRSSGCSPGATDVRGAVRGVPSSTARTPPAIVPGTLRTEADVGFATCWRGHRVRVKRIRARPPPAAS